ncbi:MAG: tetratricopeptide repeat protein [Porphyromonadaceae bacterium]|nr:tetratricopeptide repeat protein [Porphyromonadaceae bacterium]
MNYKSACPLVAWLLIALSWVQLQGQEISPEERRLKAETYFYQGIMEQNRGEGAAAQALLAYSYRLWPESAETAYALGQCYARQRDYEKTLEMFSLAYRADSTRREYFESLVSTYTWGENKEAARALLEQWVKNNPEDEDILQYLARTYFSSGDYDKAIGLYGKLQEGETSYPRYARLGEIKAALYEAAGNLPRAEAQYRATIKAFPDEVEAKVALIGWLYKQERFADAEPILTQLKAEAYSRQQLRPLMIQYHLGLKQKDLALGLLKEHLEDMQISAEDKAIRWYQFILSQRVGEQLPTEYNTYLARIAELHPDEPSAKFTYAQVLRLQGRFREAIGVVRPLCRITPEDPEVWNSLIGDAISLEDSELVFELCREALEFIQTDWRYYFYASIGLYTSGKTNEAVDLLKSGLAHIPESEGQGRSQLYAQIGDIYSEQKQIKETFEYYELALQADPDNVSVLNNYAYFLAERDQDLDKAERMAARGFKLNGDNLNMVDTYAWVFYKRGNYTLAKLYQTKAIDLAGDEATGVLYEHLGDIEFAQQEHEAAREAWQKAIELYEREAQRADASEPKVKAKKQAEELRKRLTKANK